MSFKIGDKVRLLDFSEATAAAAVKASGAGWRCDTPEEYGSEKQQMIGQEFIIDHIHHQLAILPFHKGITWPLSAMVAVVPEVAAVTDEKWTPQIGDIIRKNDNGVSYVGRFAQITEIRSDCSFGYQLLDGGREHGGCQIVHADFICRIGDKVRLLPAVEWGSGNSVGSFGYVKGVEVQQLNYYEGRHCLGRPSDPKAVAPMVILGAAKKCQARRWLLSSVERVVDEAAPVEKKEEPKSERPCVRRDPLDMLPAEREMYEAMIKRREVKPIQSCETAADSSMWNKRINERIEEKRKLEMQIKAEIDDLIKQRK